MMEVLCLNQESTVPTCTETGFNVCFMNDEEFATWNMAPDFENLLEDTLKKAEETSQERDMEFHTSNVDLCSAWIQWNLNENDLAVLWVVRDKLKDALAKDALLLNEMAKKLDKFLIERRFNNAIDVRVAAWTLADVLRTAARLRVHLDALEWLLTDASSIYLWLQWCVVNSSDVQLTELFVWAATMLMWAKQRDDFTPNTDDGFIKAVTCMITDLLGKRHCDDKLRNSSFRFLSFVAHCLPQECARESLRICDDQLCQLGSITPTSQAAVQSYGLAYRAVASLCFKRGVELHDSIYELQLPQKLLSDLVKWTECLSQCDHGIDMTVRWILLALDSMFYMSQSCSVDPVKQLLLQDPYLDALLQCTVPVRVDSTVAALRVRAALTLLFTLSYNDPVAQQALVIRGCRLTVAVCLFWLYQVYAGTLGTTPHLALRFFAETNDAMYACDPQLAFGVQKMEHEDFIEHNGIIEAVLMHIEIRMNKQTGLGLTVMNDAIYDLFKSNIAALLTDVLSFCCTEIGHELPMTLLEGWMGHALQPTMNPEMCPIPKGQENQWNIVTFQPKRAPHQMPCIRLSDLNLKDKDSLRILTEYIQKKFPGVPLLYHGTSPGGAKYIIEQGCKPTCRNGDFAAGSYSSKSWGSYYLGDNVLLSAQRGLQKVSQDGSDAVAILVYHHNDSLTKHCYTQTDDSWKKHVFHSRRACGYPGVTKHEAVVSQQEIKLMNLKHIDGVQGPIAKVFVGDSPGCVQAFPQCMQFAIKSKKARRQYDQQLLGIVYVSL